MKDPIERQDAINRITRQYKYTNGGNDRYAVGINVGITKSLNVLKDMPSAEPKHGRWILPNNKISQSLDEWICDNCNHLVSHRHNYCPNCGARMGADHD